ncbi:hypothetical protein ACET3Z_028823 [Daucus carota]
MESFKIAKVFTICIMLVAFSNLGASAALEDVAAPAPSPTSAGTAFAQNWRYAAKQFLKRYPHDVVVHCSESNHSMLTFDGVDVMGSRLADEVLSVIKRHPGLQKISFISHSLGGLVSRYAIAKLYTEDSLEEKCEVKGESPYREENARGTIAGLEPVNFITSATPHLGCRGHRQIPMFCGILAIEKAATNVSWLLGRTGKHLFLTDTNDGKPPLLLQMVHDCEDLKFISALQSFKRRVAYANARFDHIVGWSTSSLRRRNELPKKKKLPRNTRYPHVINEEPARTDHFCKAEHNDDMTDDIEGPILCFYDVITIVLVLVKPQAALFSLFSVNMVSILRCRKHGNSMMFLIFLSVSSLTLLNSMAQGRVIHNHIDLSQINGENESTVTRKMIGSRPPRCERKCRNCGHCKAVQVPIAPLRRSHKLYTAFSREKALENAMESFKIAKVFTICIMLVAFSNLGASAALEDVAAPAPSPTSAGTALYVPAALAAVASLVSAVASLF